MSARRSAFAFFTLRLGRYFFGQKFPRKWFGRGGLVLGHLLILSVRRLISSFGVLRGGNEMLEVFTLNRHPHTSNIRCRIVKRSNVTCGGFLPEVQGF